MAKCAVELDAPAGSTVVRWNEKKLVVALPYHDGRVVVATLGQWFHPETSGLGDWQRLTRMRANGIDPDQLPPESAPRCKRRCSGMSSPGSPSPPRPGRVVGPSPMTFSRRTRPRWRSSTASARPRNFLASWTPSSPARGRRQEALWAAGEAMKPQQWCQGGDALVYGWKDASGPPKLDPHYFEDLVREFPRGELRPYAQWEAAEFARIAQVRDFDASNGYGWVDMAVPIGGAAEAFAKVEAPKGSYAWRLTQIRLAQLALQANHRAEALEFARSVADVTEQGAEKSLAVFLAGVSSEVLGKPDDAARYYESARAAPDIYFFRDREDDAWSVLQFARPPIAFATGAVRRRRPPRDGFRPLTGPGRDGPESSRRIAPAGG